MRKLIIPMVLVASAASASPELDNCMRKLEYLTERQEQSRVTVKNRYFGEDTPLYQSFPHQIEEDGRTVTLFQGVRVRNEDYEGHVDSIVVQRSGKTVVGAYNETAQLRREASLQGERCFQIADEQND